MPYDGSGNFSIINNFEEDRINGVSIDSLKMDNNFNDVASGLSSVMLRSGLSAMTGTLNMASHKILNVSNGTATTDAINKGQMDTALSAKQNTITGGASTIASSNLTASRALVSNSSGKVSVSAVTATELGYLSGVTSAIQTQINGKQATITGGASTITGSNLTASRAAISNSNGKIGVSETTSTELSYVHGVTSAIQTQINAKASDSSVVKLTGTQTIGGTKTFSVDPIIKNNSPRLYMGDPSQTKGTAPSGSAWSAVEFQDNNGARLGLIRQLYDSTKLNRVELLVEKANASGDNSQATMTLYYPASGNPYATAPASSVANSILTTIAKNWDSTNKKGYYQLGNGLIIQWGSSDTSGTVTIRFPKAFTTTNYTIVGISYGGSYVVVDKNSKTTDTVSVGNTVGFDWIAIGY